MMYLIEFSFTDLGRITMITMERKKNTVKDSHVKLRPIVLLNFPTDKIRILTKWSGAQSFSTITINQNNYIGLHTYIHTFSV